MRNSSNAKSPLKLMASRFSFWGEANHDMKNELLGGAIATLFPITWREPFGLVMAESMACGTPVIATNLGSVPEVIADGETGFICDGVDECVEAIAKIPEIDRRGLPRSREFSFQRSTYGGWVRSRLSPTARSFLFSQRPSESIRAIERLNRSRISIKGKDWSFGWCLFFSYAMHRSIALV